MSTPVQRARLDVEKLEAQIKQLQDERDNIMAFVRMYDRYAGNSPMPAAPTIHSPPLKSRLLEATVVFLRERGRPAEMSDIYPMLESKGLLPGGSKPRQQVSSMLGRDGRLEYDRSIGWWLKGTPVPASTDPGEQRTLM